MDENVFGPDEIIPSGMALLTSGSDLESTNLFAIAYVQPVYDGRC